MSVWVPSASEDFGVQVDEFGIASSGFFQSEMSERLKYWGDLCSLQEARNALLVSKNDDGITQMPRQRYVKIDVLAGLL